MTNVERIHLAQEKTAAVQERLDQAQVVLEKAERVAEVEESAKSHAKQIVLFVAVVGVAVGVVMIIRRRRRGKKDED
jgi:hypothetical protein